MWLSPSAVGDGRGGREKEGEGTQGRLRKKEAKESEADCAIAFVLSRSRAGTGTARQTHTRSLEDNRRWRTRKGRRRSSEAKVGPSVCERRSRQSEGGASRRLRAEERMLLCPRAVQIGDSAGEWSEIKGDEKRERQRRRDNTHRSPDILFDNPITTQSTADAALLLTP